MSNIQKRLDSLQPYVIGIRYVSGVPVIDAVFKDGWAIPDSDAIEKAKGDEAMNYYMFFSDKDGIGIDELLEYVEKIIQLNIEREKKQELLKLKVKELSELFKNNTLSKLNSLKFVLSETISSDINMDEFDIHSDINEEMGFKKPVVKSEPETPVQTNENNLPIMEEKSYDDMSEEEREEEEAIAKAESWKKIKETRKGKNTHQNNKVKINGNNIELPPKKKVELAVYDVPESDGECECGEFEACAKCIEGKDL